MNNKYIDKNTYEIVNNIFEVDKIDSITRNELLEYMNLSSNFIEIKNL